MARPTFFIVIETIRASHLVKAEEIEQLLYNWRSSSSLGMNIVDNIIRDYHIKTEHMMEILDHLHKFGRPNEYDEKIFKIECYKHTLKGPCIDMALIEKNIGCAKTKSDFKKAIKDVYESFSDEDIDRLVSKLLSKRKLSIFERKLAVAPFSCWATWSNKAPENPFEFAREPNRVLKVTANLGLDHRQEGEPHLLFIYPKTAVGKLHIPTFADAGIYAYFNCSAPTDSYGWTKPWTPGDYIQKGLTDEDVKPRPEGVHLPVKLGDLNLPLEMIKP